jgi:hypothetical protein
MYRTIKFFFNFGIKFWHFGIYHVEKTTFMYTEFTKRHVEAVRVFIRLFILKKDNLLYQRTRIINANINRFYFVANMLVIFHYFFSTEM